MHKYRILLHLRPMCTTIIPLLSLSVICSCSFLSELFILFIGIQEAFMSKLKNSYFSYFLMYSFYYLAWAVFSCLTSVYLLDKGYKPSQVSIVVSASLIASMIGQPIIGMITDRNDLRKVNMSLFILAGIGGLAFMFCNSLITITIGYSFVMMLINGTTPIMERIATSSPYKYGKIRVWGTLGYALGSQMAGILYQYISPRSIFICFGMTIILAAIGTYYTAPDKVEKKETPEASDPGLLKNTKYIYYLIIYSLFFGIINVGGTYTPAMFQNDGLPMSTVSTILSLAVLCEMPLVFFSYKFMDRLSNKTLMIISFSLMTAMYAIYWLDMPIMIKVIATLLVKHPAGMLLVMINQKVLITLIGQDHLMTAMAFAATAKNLGSILCQNVLGPILDNQPFSSMYFICMILMAAGLVMVLLFKVPKGTDQKLFS